MASETGGAAEGALGDLRIVEYAQGVTGPFCGKAFADLGADVVKVEPLGGDRSRTEGPFPGDEPHPERSGRFLYLNTNKRGVALDVETEAGRELLRDLVASADIFIADLPPAAYGELGLDFETLNRAPRRSISSRRRSPCSLCMMEPSLAPRIIVWSAPSRRRMSRTASDSSDISHLLLIGRKRRAHIAPPLSRQPSLVFSALRSLGH